jgi:hypothetical protein
MGWHSLARQYLLRKFEIDEEVVQMRLEKGKAYTRREIASVLGGGIQEYLPHVKRARRLCLP